MGFAGDKALTCNRAGAQQCLLHAYASQEDRVSVIEEFAQRRNGYDECMRHCKAMRNTVSCGVSDAFEPA